MTTDSVPCVLLSTGERKILFPTAAIAEVVPYQAPKKIEDVPEWLLGMFLWRSIEIPLIYIEKIKHPSSWNDPSIQTQAGSLKYFVAVIHRDGTIVKDESKLYHLYPFFCIFLLKIPKRVNVSKQDLVDANLAPETTQSYWISVMLNGENVLIPNLLELWNAIDALPNRLQWFKK